ncbi:LLM class flavin-dependent oxidoreductase [Streptomyces sp. NPDC057199]|uniref:LLM class flavin-dependent oxidoreductase n=1 Tax=Streptomyces sp. NPDC057199 TaxID=3346047 RepID=UPI00362DF5D7
MLFNLFHLMPYRHLKASDIEGYDSSALVLPNRFFDPELGSALYNEYLDQLEYAEEIGFDGVCINEHHQTAYGIMPSPNVIAAMLARRTEHIKIGILGNAIAVRDNPLRVAEEVAMLDSVTRGRIISGFVRGIGWEYYAQQINPTESRARFEEAHDLIVKSWTEEGPFEWHSPHYHYRYVNGWPRPYQQPHPPIWVPGTGSTETMKWVAEHRYNYMSVFAPAAIIKTWFDKFRQAADAAGYEPAPEQLGWLIPIFIGETHEKAVADAREHLDWLYRVGLRLRSEYFYPPGYLTSNSLRGILSSGAKPFAEISYEELIEKRYVVVGSEESVTEQLGRLQDELGFGNLLALLQIGSMGPERTRENMDRFATGVMPHFKRSSSSVHSDVAAEAV